MVTRLPHRVHVRTVISTRPLAQYHCPGCDRRYMVRADVAQMYARIHAEHCHDLRTLNRKTLRCWSCEGSGHVGDSDCLVCLGRGCTTEPDPTLDRRPR